MRLIKNFKEWKQFSLYNSIDILDGPLLFPCLALSVSEDENFSAGGEIIFVYPNDVVSLIGAFAEGHASHEEYPLLSEIEEFFPLLKEAVNNVQA